MVKNDTSTKAEAPAEPMSDATREYLERVKAPVGEGESARDRYIRVQAETKELLKALQVEAKEQESAAKNAVVDELLMPEFRKLVEAAEARTGLTVRRLSLRYTNAVGEEPEFKISHQISKARKGSESE